MVAVDEQYPVSPLRAAAGQLDAHHSEPAAVLVGARPPGARCGSRRRAARPDRSGRARTARSSGARARARSAATAWPPGRRSTTGSIRRTATATIPNEIKYRFPRQTVVYLSPHDDAIVYQASHVLHRSTDEGVTWETISPDLTAHEPQYQIVPGQPDHARRHRRRGVLVDLRDGRVAAREGRDLGRRQRRSGERDARQRQDVEERHAEGPRARRARADDRRLAASQGHGLRVDLSLPARARSQAVHLQDRTTTARRGRSSPTARTASRSIIPCTSSAKIRRAKGCSTPAPSSARSSRSTTAATGSRCSRTCRRRR